MRVLVCGGREYDDEERVFSILDAFHRDCGPIAAIIHGGAAGADLLGHKWAIRNLPVLSVKFSANWKKHGKRAGPIRNQLMLDVGKPDHVIAFPGGRGTADMILRAKAAGIPVREVIQ